MEKEKLISKLNIKDYNNQLERILSKKNFSEEIKNLLLNMLYKIENSYKDYTLVTVSNRTKKDILEEVLSIIENECETIDVVDKNESTSIPEAKVIKTFLNPEKMLYEIYQIKKDTFKVPKKYEIISEPLKTLLNQGYSIASAEIIRDFDGWSWNIISTEIENHTANFVYQTLKILVGQSFLEKWQKEDNKDYIILLTNELEKSYGAELTDKLLKTINQIAIINLIEINENKKDKFIEIQQNLQEKYNEIVDKKEYIDKLVKEKRKITNRIKQIANLINDDIKLKEDFIEKNEELDMQHRIFSISDYVEILEQEREEKIKKLENLNKKMEPLNYIREKTNLEDNLELIKELNLQNYDKSIYDTKIKELLSIVLKMIKINININDEKEDLIKLIYKLRYYSNIYVKENEQVKDVIDLNDINRYLITKACKKNIITIFSLNIKENYEVLKNIFQPEIIELEKIHFKLMKKDNILLLDIYDEDTQYKSVELTNIGEINVKMNKKIKVFI